MSRVRVAVGLMATAIGTAWWAGALPLAWKAFLGAAPYLLLLLAAFALLAALAPPAVLVGPAVLFGVGMMWLAIRNGHLRVDELGTLLPAALVLGGFGVALIHGPLGPRTDPVLWRRALVWPRKLQLGGTAPGKLSIGAFLTTITADLSRTDFPHAHAAVEVDVTVIAGGVNLIVPAAWLVVPGRLHTRATHFDGDLDRLSPVFSPSELTDRKEAIVVNIVGLGGSVVIQRR